jgi:hypothetical protein
MDGLSHPPRAEPPPQSPALSEMDWLQREKEALRIQAAAVAAQQAALTEEEIKLGQRATALARQEAQLAEHLEAKRSQLAGLQEQVGAARAALRQERSEFEQHSKGLLAQAKEERGEAAKARQAADHERARFVELRRRLKRRWRAHWTRQEEALRRREKELENEWLRLAQEADRVQSDREAQQEDRLHCKAGIELDRRRLLEARAEQAREQSEWAQRRSQEQRALHGQAKALRDQESILAEVERDLQEEKLNWEGMRLHLRKEIEGLESRALNVRQKLIEQQVAMLPARESLPESANFPAPIPAPPKRVDFDLVESLERLAGDLADQRVQLAEQFGRLALIEEWWRTAHSETVAELEAVAHELNQRDEALDRRGRNIEAAEADLERGWEDLVDNRCQMEGRRSQLASREKAWENERGILLAHVQSSEEQAKREFAALDELRRKWKQRRRQDNAEMQRAHAEFIEARRMYATLWEDCLRRSADLDHEKRTLAEKALTLEQYRLELISQAEDAATAEKQIERLRRRWSSLFHEAERNLKHAQETLHAECERMDGCSRQIEQDTTELTRRAAEQVIRVTEWEDHQFHVDEANIRLRKELETLRFERSQQERQIAGLREDVERMAMTLLEPTQTQLPSPRQAA